MRLILSIILRSIINFKAHYTLTISNIYLFDYPRKRKIVQEKGQPLFIPNKSS